MTHRERSIPLAQRVYEGLLEDIAAGRRLAGERLVEAAIAREMDVSRTPVREALNRLANDGLIQGTKPSGYIVITPSMADLHEIFEIRQALEPVAFANVVAGATPEDDAEFQGLFDAVQVAHTPEASAKANKDFRAFWVDRIRNTRMRETLLRFHLQVQLVRNATLHSEEGRNAARIGTQDIAAAYFSRDTAAAFTAMRNFVDAALVFFQRADKGGFSQSPSRSPKGREALNDRQEVSVVPNSVPTQERTS